MPVNRSRIIISSGIAAFILLSLIVILHFKPSPPLKSIDTARKAISQAVKDNAGEYSPDLLRDARAFYDSAMIYWRRENRKFVYSRDYTKISSFANISVKKAKLASDKAKDLMPRLKADLMQRMKKLKNVETDLTREFDNYPLTTETRNRISKGKFILKEAEIDFNGNDFLDAGKKLRQAEELLTSSYDYANDNLKNYFRSYPEWRKWVDKTIAESREKQDYSIIVDKYSRKVMVYLNGIKQFEYHAELGRNWVGDKKIRGDKATPEGMYKIVKKYNEDSSQYYKALLIDYPNDEDSISFEKAKALGTIPRYAKIGGMIEIHGNGGKGVDWTEGCIAITDREMDKVFEIAKVGTPVTIVGSTHDLRYLQTR